jgi:hypothetical protein
MCFFFFQQTSTPPIDSSKLLQDELTCKLLPYNLLNQLLRILHISGGSVHVTAGSLPVSPAAPRHSKVPLSGIEVFVPGSSESVSLRLECPGFHAGLQSALAAFSDTWEEDDHQIPAPLSTPLPLQVSADIMPAVFFFFVST